MGHTAGVAGLEPANAGVKVPCLTTWRHPIAGCPPHDAADQSACICRTRQLQASHGDFSNRSRSSGLRPTFIGRLYPTSEKKEEGRIVGLEPTTSRATIWRSTTELYPPQSHGDFFKSHMHGGLSSPKSARLEGLEPPTHGLEGRCSIQLSYRRRPETRQSILRTSC